MNSSQRRQQRQDDGADQHIVRTRFHDLCLPPLRGRGRTSARPVKIFLNPRMVQSEQLFNRSDRDDLLVGQHRHPVADRVKRVEIVGDEENGQVELVAQRLGSARRNSARAIGSRPGGRLVEEQQFGIERQRPRQAGALEHAAGQLGRIFGARHRAAGRPWRSCSWRSRPSAWASDGKYSRNGTSTFSATVRVENKAPFWNRMPQRRRIFLASSSSRPIIFSPSTSTSPASGVCSPMIERISTDLPVPEPPTTPRISPRLTSRSRSSWMTCSPRRRCAARGCG